MDVPFSQIYKALFLIDVSLFSIIPQREFKNIIRSSNQMWSISLRKKALLYISLYFNCQSIIAVFRLSKHRSISRYKLLFSKHGTIHTHTYAHSFSPIRLLSYFLSRIISLLLPFPYFHIRLLDILCVFSICSFYTCLAFSLPLTFSVSFSLLPFRYNGAGSSLLFRILHG